MIHEFIGISDASINEGRRHAQEEAAHGVLCGCFQCGKKAEQIAGEDVPSPEQAREILGLPNRFSTPSLSEAQMRKLLNFDGNGEVRKASDEEKVDFKKWYIKDRYDIGEEPKVEYGDDCTAWLTVDPATISNEVKPYARIVPTGAVMIPAVKAVAHAIPSLPVDTTPMKITALETYQSSETAKVAHTLPIKQVIFEAKPDNA